MIYGGHVMHCRVFLGSPEHTYEFKAPFTTCGLDDDQRLDLAIYTVRSAYCDILAQLHAAGVRTDSRTQWWATTHKVLDTDSAAPIELVAARG